MRIGLNVEHEVMKLGDEVVYRYSGPLEAVDSFPLAEIDAYEAVEILQGWFNDAEDHCARLAESLDTAYGEMGSADKKYWVSTDGAIFAGVGEMSGPVWREVSKEEALNILSGE